MPNRPLDLSELRRLLSIHPDHMVADGEDLGWLIEQTLRWPDRVHPECTTNDAFLRFSMAATMLSHLSRIQALEEENGWRPIETFDAEPHGQANRVLIVCGDVVGEAWFRDPDGANDSWDSGWWWAGTGPGDYHADPVIETNDPPTHWRPLPSAPTNGGER